MRPAIVAGVASIRTGRRFDRRTVWIEQNTLQRSPEDLVPYLALRRGEINRRRRHPGQFLLVTDPCVEERNRGCQFLLGRGSRIRQRPDITQSIVLSNVIAEGVAQNRHQWYP